MKAVILAGGLGSRLSEETVLKPKPMVEIGGKPILWHVLKIYSTAGIHEFIICLGYKGYLIKEYFANYFLHMCDVTFHMDANQMEVHHRGVDPWHVTLIDTGEGSQTGGRLRHARPYLNGDEAFCMTYGDGVADIDINKLLKFHRQQKTLATVTAVQLAGRFGSLDINGHKVNKFIEKPIGDGNWINGGFFVLSPKVLDYIEGNLTRWEIEPLSRLAAEGQLSAYQHEGFWHPMDTIRDKNYLEELWNKGNAPWKIW